MYGLMPKREYQGPGRKGEEVGDPAVSDIGIRVCAKACKSTDPISLELRYPSLSHETQGQVDQADRLQ